MKYSDIENSTVGDLKKKYQVLTADLFSMKMKNKLGQLSNPLSIRFIRKDIARIKTVLTKATKKQD